MSRFPFADQDVPTLTTDQMREVDRLMVEEYRIDLFQMMENAGRNLAHLARTRFLDGDPRDKRVVVLAGSGGNGGGALVAARRLHGYGAGVSVHLSRDSEDFTPVPKRQLEILQRLDISLSSSALLEAADPIHLIIDGMLGYSLRGAPRDQAASLIRQANGLDTSVLALDVPSGIDATTGTVFDPAIRATATMTLALPKSGLRQPSAAEYVGELYLADIGVPPALYAQPGLELSVGHIFALYDIIRLG